ncbi:MAG: VWA domain-containing protein [Acidobacteria bacterium]|nr:VWA domain-containing protein [Acidobacteriota bacterium]
MSAIRSVLCLFTVAATVTMAAAQSRRVQPTPTPTPQDETLKIHTEEIRLNVLAFDEGGKFFEDVKPEDLVITENDVLHQPSSVRRVPANVLIVMDTGGELRVVKSLDNTRKIAYAVVNSLRPGDSVGLVEYADKADVVQEWTSDKKEIFAAIKRTNFGRRSDFVDALKLSRDLFLRSGLDNKHLVLITDGTDSFAKSSDKFDALQALLTTDITVHVISYTAMESMSIEPRTKGTSKTPPPKALPPEVEAQLPNGVKPPGAKVGPTVSLDRTLIRRMKDRKLDLDISQGQLEKIAENSNGEFILPDNFDEMLLKAPLVSRMIDSSYVVTYMPKLPVVETRGVAERDIVVSSKRTGLVVQARRKLLIASK